MDSDHGGGSGCIFLDRTACRVGSLRIKVGFSVSQIASFYSTSALISIFNLYQLHLHLGTHYVLIFDMGGLSLFHRQQLYIMAESFMISNSNAHFELHSFS